MISILLAACVILYFILKQLKKEYYLLTLCKRIKTLDGGRTDHLVLPAQTILGHFYDVLQKNQETHFTYNRNNAKQMNGKSYIQLFLTKSVYNIINAEDAEQLLQSQTLITKGIVYDIIQPLLGDGLLISADEKWHFRRKLLTPTFHFNILQNFLEIFKEESSEFIAKLQAKGNVDISLDNLIPEFTLNNVCETALGVKLNDISGSEQYRQAIRKIEKIFMRRTLNILQYFKTIYYLTCPLEIRRLRKLLKIAHDFSSEIIKKKRQEFQKMQQTREAANSAAQKDISFKKLKRYAMLDMLLHAESEQQIDHQDICDEVNTFMFEGFDTTSTGLTFAIFNLATHQDVQAKCYNEVKNLTNLNELSIFDINNLSYLECVIKETLRLYPSVPLMTRTSPQEIKLNGLLFPAHTEFYVHNFDIMRDARHFPQPNQFQPERFSLENSKGRHPYAFVGFSAGSRNCIGQKFAMLEMKMLLCAILKEFRIEALTHLDDIILEYGIVLRSQNPIKVRFVKRNA